MLRNVLPITDSNRRWWIAAATGISLGIVILDEVMVAVALPTIRDELGLSQLGSQWIVNAYALSLTVLVAAGGRLGDLFGHRRMFMIGIGITIVGSVGAGLAQGEVSILAARAVQGAGAAILYPLGFAMTGIAFSDRDRGTGVAVAGVISAVLGATGPFVGGLLTDVLSWRWIFFINIPLLIVVAAAISFAWRDPERSSTRVSFDGQGLAVLAVFLVPLVVALMQTPVWGWGSPAVLGLLALSMVALAAFVWTERRVASPLLELRQLRRPTVIGANLAIFASQFSKIAVLIFGALFLQDRLGFSPLLAGTAMLATVVPWVVTGIWSGLLTDRYGPRIPTLAGAAALGISLAWLALLINAENYFLLLPGLLLWGLALPLIFNPPVTAALNAVAAEQRGEASGVLSTGRQLGGALAVAVLGASFVANENFAAVFWIATAVTVAVWVALYLLLDRRGSRLTKPESPGVTGVPVTQAAGAE